MATNPGVLLLLFFSSILAAAQPEWELARTRNSGGPPRPGVDATLICRLTPGRILHETRIFEGKITRKTEKLTDLPKVPGLIEKAFKASNGEMRRIAQIPLDAATENWMAGTKGKLFVIKLGFFDGKNLTTAQENSTPEAAELIKVLDKYCQ